jgi:hypothetical protein
MLKRFDDPFNEEMGGTVLEGYDTAQVCLNGHPINEFAETQPEHNSKFCAKCGAQTIAACSECNTKIRGYHHSPGVVSLINYLAPAFCYQCGNPYPWTGARLNAARELARELDKLDDKEKDILSRSLDDLIRETPNTPVAVTRFKRLVTKAGSVAADGFKTILLDVLSEAVKRQIWP